MALIEQADVWLFQLLNLHLVHPAADDLMVFLTRERLSGHIFLLAALFIAVRKGKRGFCNYLLRTSCRRPLRFYSIRHIQTTCSAYPPLLCP